MLVANPDSCKGVLKNILNWCILVLFSFVNFFAHDFDWISCELEWVTIACGLKLCTE